MSNIILISGATRSGKSDFAEYLAKNYKEVTYIALSDEYPNDKEWQTRILKHKIRRPKHWQLIETNDLLHVLKNNDKVLLIDSIGGFVVKYLNKKDEEWKLLIKELIINLENYEEDLIIVGEQTGWGLVSEHKIGNKFVERLGETLKQITTISKDNWLTINGRAIKLDNIFFEIPK